MKAFLYAISFIIFIIANVSCGQQKPQVNEVTPAKIIKPITHEVVKFSNGIRCVFHDSNGNYWIGSHQEGLAMYDGEKYTYFTTEDGLSDNQIRAIQEDDKGNIWLGTAAGVTSYNGEKFTIHEVVEIYQENVPLKSQLSDEDLWFNAGNNNGAVRYDGTQLEYLSFPSNFEKTSNSSFALTGYTRASDGKVWMATYGAVFNYNGNSFETFDDTRMGIITNRNRLHVRSIFSDSNGNIWIGNNGIGVLMIKDGETTNFSADQGLIHAYSTGGGNRSPPGTLEHVFAISEDTAGNIWYGDRDTGAWRYDGQNMTNYIVDGNLSMQHIWDIYQDGYGNLLFSMGAGGVYRFNGNSFDRFF